MQSVRIGSYGIVVQSSKLLTVYKKTGPYQGLWDLPGGKIEFGETPEEALLRELKEEVAMQPLEMELVSSASFCNQDFHHLGFIYLVKAYSLLDTTPEEEMRWIHLSELREEELTPFLSKEILQKALSSRESSRFK
jgi:8-oxo-dGTP diphosphatase